MIRHSFGHSRFWRALLWAAAAVVGIAILGLALLGALSLGFVTFDELMPRENGRITGMAIVFTAIATMLLVVATGMLFFATQRLAKATTLTIATEAPLIAFQCRVEDEIRTSHDATYLETYQRDDLKHYLWRAAKPIQYVRLDVQNTQTRPYAVAREVIVTLILHAKRKSDGMTALSSPVVRNVPILIVPPDTAFSVIAFNVGALQEFSVEVQKLAYRDLHSELVRAAGFGMGWIHRTEDGIVTKDWRVSRPNPKEVPR